MSQNEIERRVINIVSDALGKHIDLFKVSDDLVRQHKADAFDYLSIEISLEDEFNIVVLEHLMENTNTIQQIIDIVKKKRRVRALKKQTLSTSKIT